MHPTSKVTYSFMEDYDYTTCDGCQFVLEPYTNLSIASITSSIAAMTASTISTAKDLKDLVRSSFISALIDYHHFHCQKCGLYIEIHPEVDQEGEGWQKVFICADSESLGPHQYCLCYHCGLLYEHEETAPETQCEDSISREVDDDDDHSQSVEEKDDSNRNLIDESYMNILSLQHKLTLLSNVKVTSSGTGSWPASPQMKGSHSNKVSQSLKGSPLCMETVDSSRSTPPSMRLELMDSETKWREYLEQQHRERSMEDSSKGRKGRSYGDKMRAQSQKLEELEKLQRELTMRKKQEKEQFAKLLRNGMYKSRLEM